MSPSSNHSEGIQPESAIRRLLDRETAVLSEGDRKILQAAEKFEQTYPHCEPAASKELIFTFRKELGIYYPRDARTLSVDTELKGLSTRMITSSGAIRTIASLMESLADGGKPCSALRDVYESAVETLVGVYAVHCQPSDRKSLDMDKKEKVDKRLASNSFFCDYKELQELDQFIVDSQDYDEDGISDAGDDDKEADQDNGNDSGEDDHSASSVGDEPDSVPDTN